MSTPLQTSNGYFDDLERRRHVGALMLLRAILGDQQDAAPERAVLPLRRVEPALLHLPTSTRRAVAR